MELRHLKYFLAVAEELNFRLAAERLHVSQPSLSVQVRQLEEEIGARLFHRNTHQVILTAVGARFYEDCRHLLQQAEDSVRTARQIERGEAGCLSIGFVGSLGHGLMPQMLRTYRRKYPEVELRLSEMDTAQQLEAIEARRLDLGFIGLGVPREQTDLQLTLVAEEKLMAVVAQDHLLARQSLKKPLRLSAFRKEKFLLGSRLNAPVYNPWIVMLCQQAGFHPNVIQETGQPIAVLNYVAAGLGVTILPAQFSRQSTVGVRFLPLAPPTPCYRYYAAWSAKNQYAALQHFVEIAKTTLQRRRHRSDK